MKTRKFCRINGLKKFGGDPPPLHQLSGIHAGLRRPRPAVPDTVPGHACVPRTSGGPSQFAQRLGAENEGRCFTARSPQIGILIGARRRRPGAQAPLPLACAVMAPLCPSGGPSWPPQLASPPPGGARPSRQVLISGVRSDFPATRFLDGWILVSAASSQTESLSLRSHFRARMRSSRAAVSSGV